MYDELKILVTIGATFKEVVISANVFMESRPDVDWDCIIGWTGNDLVQKDGTKAIEAADEALLVEDVTWASKTIQPMVN